MSVGFAAFFGHARQVIRSRPRALALCAVLILAGLGLLLRRANGSRSRGAMSYASGARLAEIDSSFSAIADGERDTPRDSWDPDYVVSKLGRDPQVLFAWVRRNTFWIPYRGVLRGPVGVLLDRQGNSLDRALLLATLLDKAGHKVRLAHGTMSRDRAVGLLPALVARRAAAFVAVAAMQPARSPDLRPMAAQYHLDGAVLEQRLSQQEKALAKVAAALDARVTEQTTRLWDALPHRDIRPSGTTGSQRRSLRSRTTGGFKSGTRTAGMIST